MRHRAYSVMLVTTARNAWYIFCSLRAPKNTQRGDQTRVSTLGVHTPRISELQSQAKRCRSNSDVYEVLYHHLSLAHVFPPAVKRGGTPEPHLLPEALSQPQPPAWALLALQTV